MIGRNSKYGYQYDPNDNLDLNYNSSGIRKSNIIPSVNPNIPSLNESNYSLKEICSQDINNNIYLNVKNPLIYGAILIGDNNEILHSDKLKSASTRLRAKKYLLNKNPDINRNVPEFDNSLSLKEICNGDTNSPINLNVKNQLIYGAIFSGCKTQRLPPVKIEEPKTQLRSKRILNKKPDIVPELDKPITLKDICNRDINNPINLKVKNPEIWGVNNYNSSGIINGKNKLPSVKRINPSSTLKEICSGDINDNIKLNVKNPKLWGVDDFNLSGKIEGRLPSVNINIPNINLRGKKPDVELNIKKHDISIPGIDINMNRSRIEDDFKKLTLKEICNREINNPINLNVKNPIIRKVDDYNLSGVIDGRLSSGKIKKPNINIPTVNLRSKKPNINLNIKKPEINVPDVNCNDSDFIDKHNSLALNVINPNMPGEYKLNMPKISTGNKSVNLNLETPETNNIKLKAKKPNPKKEEDTFSLSGVIKGKPKKSHTKNESNFVLEGVIPSSINANLGDSICGIIPGSKRGNRSSNLGASRISTHKPVNRPKLDINEKKPFDNLRESNISANIPNMNFKVSNLDTNVYDNLKNKINNSITLKELFSGETNEKVKIKNLTLNPKGKIAEDDYEYVIDDDDNSLNMASPRYKAY